MSEACGFVIKVEHLRPHTNADKLQILTVFGEDTCVGLDVKIGDFGIYFPCDLQLSLEYCDYNHLCRKDAEGNKDKGYLEREKRNIKAIRLRGEKSFGLFMPLESLAYTGEVKFEIGDHIDVVNGHDICRKYIPRGSNRHSGVKGNKGRKTTVDIAPLFAQHVDTEQLAYHLGDFKQGDLIEITLKVHGTSQRTGYLPKLSSYKRTLLDRILRREGTPIYKYGYVTGTRRTVLNDFEKGGYYGDNSFREPHALAFQGKLFQGETVYYEVCGFTNNGTPIMPQVSNSKVSDKAFSRQYGPTTTFSYGCTPDGKKMFYGRDDEGDFALEVELPQSRLFVYRMTKTTEDGHVVEYPPDYMRYRCEQMGVESVPILWRGIIPSDYDRTDFSVNVDNYRTAGDWVKVKAEEFYDGPDPIGKTHIREGVVIRIVDKPKFCAYKHKNFNFKCLSGVAIDSLAEKDIESIDEDILSEM